jgi:phosphate:Na+ symporter
MEYSFGDFLQLLGSLALFLYGMKLMSEGIQKAAGEGLRNILSSMTRNRVFGVLTGFLITFIIQSSSATSVMTVSFVNAGLLTLTESVGIMMGANVGTTVTAWFISLFGFKVDLGAIAIPVMAVGVPMLFVKSTKVRFWGETVIGFSLLFYGLMLMKGAVPDIKENPEMLSFVQNITNMGYMSYILFVFIGTVLTVVIQSSSATMAITLVMTAQGWIGFDIAASMVLGENIGTTITAQLAALAANVHAKRSAMIHTIFNVFGVVWMLIVFRPVLQGIAAFYGYDDPSGFLQDPTETTFALAIFHTLFNVVNVLIMINFVPQLADLAMRIVKSKGKSDEEFRLEFINTSLSSPEVAALEAKKEIIRMGAYVTKMSGFVETLMVEKDEKKREKLMKKLEAYEEVSDRLEEEVSDFLSKVSKLEQSATSSASIQMMLGLVHDLENIADIFVTMGSVIINKNKKKIWFTPEQREKLSELFKLVKDSLKVMNQNLTKWNISDEDVARAEAAEIAVDKMRKKLRKNYLSKIEEGEYNVRGGILYAELFNSFERLADYAHNVTDGLAGKS